MHDSIQKGLLCCKQTNMTCLLVEHASIGCKTHMLPDLQMVTKCTYHSAICCSTVITHVLHTDELFRHLALASISLSRHTQLAYSSCVCLERDMLGSARCLVQVLIAGVRPVVLTAENSQPGTLNTAGFAGLHLPQPLLQLEHAVAPLHR